MTTLKKYLVYLDDGKNVYKEYVPAVDEDDAREYVRGNGDVIAVYDDTEKWPIDANFVAYTLKENGFGQTEIDLITRTLRKTGIAE